MKLLSLFSGIGAFEKALDNLEIQYELVAYCEIDKHASKSYSAIHGIPETMNLGDITKVDEKALPNDIDLITYGFPCQDISLAGKQKGLFNEDGSQTRSGLFFEALRIIEATKPRVAIAENVKNLTSKKFAEQFGIVLNSLEEAGYNNYWKVLNAKDYGIPQSRERVFVVSIRKDVDNNEFKFPQGIELKTTVSDFADFREKDDLTKSFYNFYRKSNPEKSYEEFIDYIENLPVKKNDIQTKDLNMYSFCEMNTITMQEGISGTLTCRNVINYNKKFYNNQKLYRPSPRMCWLLQGFDIDDFEKAEKVSDDAQLWKQAGNSIAVSCPYYIFKSLIEANIFKEKEEKEMELQIKPFSIPEVIEFNYEELEREITKKSSDYVNLVYTDEQIQDAKKDRATLNKFVKVLDDERKRIKKECLKPYENVEPKFKKLEGIVNKAIKNIDDQVKDYEEKQKKDKLAAIEGYWKACEKPFEIPLEKVMSKTWLNASVSLKSVYGAIDVFLEKTASDLATLENLPEFSFEATEVYKSTLDLNKAISEGQKLADMAKRKAEAERLAAERKAEMERQKAEAELAKHMNPPIEEPCEIPHEAFEDCRQNQKEPQRQWIGFKAHLTVEEAHQLKNFFDCRGIEFEAIAI